MAAQPHLDLSTTRASLLLRLKADGTPREVAWTEFYNTYSPVISGFARRLGAGRTEVEDLIQEVLQAFFATSPEFIYDPKRGRFRGYLKTCVWHKMAEVRRKRQRESDSLSQLTITDEAAAEEVWNDVWETERLHRAVDLVRNRYAGTAERERTFRAFEMCALLDRSPEHVAKDLGISVESVRAAKSRVSKALREEFEALDEKTG